MTPFKSIFGEDGYGDMLDTGERLSQEHLDNCSGCALCESDDEPILDEDQEYKDQEINALKAN